MSIPIADQTASMRWHCTCGQRPWAHAEHCVCGNARPAPVEAVEPPSDLTRPELPEIDAGAPWRLPAPRTGVVAREPRPWVPIPGRLLP